MPKDQRGVRDLLRRRMLLVHQRTLHHLSLQSLIVRHTGQQFSANQIKGLEQDYLNELLPEPICVGGQVTLQAMRWFEQSVKLLEHEVEKRLQIRQDYSLLTSIPGVGKILGATIALETGEIYPSSLKMLVRWLQSLTPIT
ncbi:MAG: hypothetical protein HQL49_12530 [Gammaproteobacteria bacterium]|nr:hypothetical protein [Gammaproteobacteria bacterium]